MLRQKVTNGTVMTTSTSQAAMSAATGRMPDAAVRLTGALLALGVTTVHIADQGGVAAFAAPPDWIGWSYRFIEVGGILTALALLLPWQRLLTRSARLSRSGLMPVAVSLGWAAALLLAVGPFLGYLASRSIGVPGDPGDVGNWGYWVGTVSLFVEGALIVLSITVLLAIRQSFRSAAPAGRTQASLNLVSEAAKPDLHP
jgi:hypothetical protein